MVVYQALKRLVGSAKVQAVLDSSSYEQVIEERRLEKLEDLDEQDTERRRYYLDNTSKSSDPRIRHLSTEPYLTPHLFPPLLQEDYDDCDPLDPASIEHYVTYPGGGQGKRRSRPAFSKDMVTWLNGQPRSFTELAVAFIAVS